MKKKSLSAKKIVHKFLLNHLNNNKVKKKSGRKKFPLNPSMNIGKLKKIMKYL